MEYFGAVAETRETATPRRFFGFWVAGESHQKVSCDAVPNLQDQGRESTDSRPVSCQLLFGRAAQSAATANSQESAEHADDSTCSLQQADGLGTLHDGGVGQ